MMKQSRFKDTLFATLVMLAATPLSSHATTITLDFGNTVQYDANNTAPYTLYFNNVATGIDATLVATSGAWDAFKSTAPCKYVAGPNNGNNCPGGTTQTGLGSTSLQWPHGSVNGDARVFADEGEEITFTLNLWDAGTGYADAYDPGVDFDWTLAFFDIDGSNGYSGGPAPQPNWDELTLLSPGTYSVTGTTALIIDDTGPGVSFSGRDAGGVTGQEGLAPEMTQAQADVMVLYTIHNLSSATFSYYVNPGSLEETLGRNLLIDGGALALATCTDSPGNDCGFEPPTGVVPVPAAVWLFGSGLLGLVGVARRKKVA